MNDYLDSNERHTSRQIEANAILSEYNVLRDEIKQYHSERNSYVNYVILITVGAMALLSSNQLSAKILLITLLTLPSLYSILGLLYLDRSARILRLSDYIHNYLRNDMLRLTEIEIWNWEPYKNQTKRLPRVITMVLDRIRIFIFFFPSFLCFGMYFLSKGRLEQRAEIVLFVLSLIFVVILILAYFFIEETTGERSPEQKMDC